MACGILCFARDKQRFFGDFVFRDLPNLLAEASFPKGHFAKFFSITRDQLDFGVSTVKKRSTRMMRSYGCIVGVARRGFA